MTRYEHGLAAYRQQEGQAGPISMHVSAINSMLMEKRAALQRLLDLYLSGEFHKDMLIDKRTELGSTIADLEKECAGSLASMRTQSISPEQEQTLLTFARKVSERLDRADSSFQWRHDFVEALGVEAILTQEEGSKTLRMKCVLGKDDKEHLRTKSECSIQLDAVRNRTAIVWSLDCPDSKPD